MISIEQSRDFDIMDLAYRSTENVPDAVTTLRNWLRRSEEVWICRHDGELACVWGLSSTSIVSDRVYLWMLTTELVDHHKFIFIRYSQIVVQEALKRYPIIVGTVKVGNDRARKWLRWLGAVIGPPVNGYSAFEIRRKE